ncbi:NUDIX domain-containing protein [Paenibacillus nanensis]|uniref:NUDIX domain-containing protein n=1 Tax=Paenibacillus nanensis TaxID=393251 RepID=A0A3A1UNP3_9BACL|nr:NUDIX domain-containing protein [Paenibacillus nanensis]RIX50149.1 NUDIX domain-containing protein [Paenibacillus nanensis]
MGYIEALREKVGNDPVILVRPSVLIVNPKGEILLVRHDHDTWGVPGGHMELGETVEESAIREIKEEVGLRLKKLTLYGVFSGNELYTRLRNGHVYYNVVIGYLCTEYEGELKPDGIEVLEAKFFRFDQLPESTDPYVRKKVMENSGALMAMLPPK